MRFRPRLIEVEAWRVGGREIKPAWLEAAIADGVVYWQGGERPHYTIEMAPGDPPVRACLGDWIVKGPDDVLRACTAGVFRHTYQQVTRG